MPPRKQPKGGGGPTPGRFRNSPSNLQTLWSWIKYGFPVQAYRRIQPGIQQNSTEFLAESKRNQLGNGHFYGIIHFTETQGNVSGNTARAVMLESIDSTVYNRFATNDDDKIVVMDSAKVRLFLESTNPFIAVPVLVGGDSELTFTSTSSATENPRDAMAAALSDKEYALNVLPEIIPRVVYDNGSAVYVADCEFDLKDTFNAAIKSYDELDIQGFYVKYFLGLFYVGEDDGSNLLIDKIDARVYHERVRTTILS
jgi:hypothetical protein